MNETPPSWIDQFNQGVRGLVTLVLTGGLVWGFIFSDKISAEVYSTIIASVIAYWFASREAKARATDPPLTTTTRTPDTTVVTGPTPTVGGSG